MSSNHSSLNKQFRFLKEFKWFTYTQQIDSNVQMRRVIIYDFLLLCNVLNPNYILALFTCTLLAIANFVWIILMSMNDLFKDESHKIHI